VYAADPPSPAASAAARPTTGTLADGVSPSATVAAGPPLLAPLRGRPPRTAFVLAGGASLGAMQAGMLRALDERGIRPDLLAGTSAGALNAPYIASRAQTVQTAKALAPRSQRLRNGGVQHAHWRRQPDQAFP
jgi:hypothetical protein